MMKKLPVINSIGLIIILFFSLSFHFVNAKEMKTVVFRDYGFSIRLQEQDKIYVFREMEDFVILRLKRQSSDIAQVYVGNAPNFPSSMPRAATSSSFLINKLPGKSHEENAGKNKQLKSREVLATMPTSRHWPLYLHIDYKNLSNKEAESIDAEIISIKSI